MGRKAKTQMLHAVASGLKAELEEAIKRVDKCLRGITAAETDEVREILRAQRGLASALLTKIARVLALAELTISFWKTGESSVQLADILAAGGMPEGSSDKTIWRDMVYRVSKHAGEDGWKYVRLLRLESLEGDFDDFDRAHGALSGISAQLIELLDRLIPEGVSEHDRPLKEQLNQRMVDQVVVGFGDIWDSLGIFEKIRQHLPEGE
jgi:hypothetical protein